MFTEYNFFYKFLVLIYSFIRIFLRKYFIFKKKKNVCINHSHNNMKYGIIHLNIIAIK